MGLDVTVSSTVNSIFPVPEVLGFESLLPSKLVGSVILINTAVNRRIARILIVFFFFIEFHDYIYIKLV